MFSYACIIVAFIIARFSHKDYRAISYLVCAEFLCHKLAFLVIGDNRVVFLLYAFIEAVFIYLISRKQDHLIICTLIFINIGYNMLTISGYSMNLKYDFFDNFEFWCGLIMILELLYLVGITAYVRNYIAKQGYLNTHAIDRHFWVRRRIYYGKIL